MQRSGPRDRRGYVPIESNRFRQAFTLIEILVVLAIISLLSAILFPAFARARENARSSACLSNLKQVNLAMNQYSQDFDEHFPPISSGQYNVASNPYIFWPNFVLPYIKNTQVFTCPDFPNDGNTVGAKPTSANFYVSGSDCSYAFNVGLGTGTYPLYIPMTVSQVNYPAEIGLLFEENSIVIPGQCNGYYDYQAFPTQYYDQPGPYITEDKVWWSITDPNGLVDQGIDFASPDTRHFGGCNVSYFDGHVKWQTHNAIYNPPPGVSGANFRLWHPKAA